MADNHKMEIIVKDIPETGLELHFVSNRDSWFQRCLVDSLADLYQKENRGCADITLLRTGLNVACTGRVVCDCFPTCSRCLKVFHYPLDLPFHLTLAPLYESEQELKRLQEEEVELVKEDLEFAYYEGDRFDLGAMIREQIILGVPMQPLCQETCKGLCPKCGQNLNESSCQCQPAQTDPRWTPLQVLKKRSD